MIGRRTRFALAPGPVLGLCAFALGYGLLRRFSLPPTAGPVVVVAVLLALASVVVSHTVAGGSVIGSLALSGAVSGGYVLGLLLDEAGSAPTTATPTNPPPLPVEVYVVSAVVPVVLGLGAHVVGVRRSQRR